MKKFLLPLFVLLFFANQTKAQFMVSVGNDTTACQGTTLVLFIDYPGTPPSGSMLYEWTPSTGITTPNGPQFPNFQIDSTITYILKVTDLLLVDSAYDTITITALPNPTTFFTVSDTMICAGNTVTFTSTTTGGTPPYTYGYNFANGNGANSNQADPYTIYSQQGSYSPSLITADANGCLNEYDAPYTINVYDVAANALLTPIICHGANDGTMQAVIISGTPPFTFVWSNGATTQTITNLGAGTYWVTVTEAHGCATFSSNTLTEPATLNVQVTTIINESQPNACDGAIVLGVNGGVLPYTFLWNNAATVQSPNGLCAGTYIVTVTDGNGCTGTSVAQITGSNCINNTLAVAINSHNLSCSHQQDTMTVTVAGGTLPYSFTWNTGDTNDSVIAYTQGVYTVYVTDSNGCTRSATDTILNTGLVINQTLNVPTGCNGTATGQLGITPTGGTPPYTIQWSNTATTDTITHLAVGTYQVTVTDAASCSQILALGVGQISTNGGYYVYISSSPANCGNNGILTAAMHGGTTPYAYHWNTGDTTATLTNLAPGYYSVTVTSANGCVAIGYGYVNSTCATLIQGYIYADTNSNCIKDTAETVYANTLVYATTNNGSSYYGYTDANGFYSIQVNTAGNYTVNVNGGWLGCANTNLCGGQSINVTAQGNTVTQNIGVGSASGFDLAIHPGWTSANPGFQKDYWVLYQQLSQPLYTGPAVITFTYDPILVYISSTNGGIHNVTNHTVTWNLASVPQQWVPWGSRPMAYFTVPANTPVGYQLTQDFLITPTSDDCDTTDNHLLVIEPVTGSRDPNEKDVSPAGDIQEEDSVLTYTIHFQNTGNDTTYFITVKDTLSPYLNPATVVNLASSHEYTSFTVSENGILTWLFNPIFLVDSFTNEAASKGFVMFKVKKKAGLPLNTEIKNRAHIYFDYNEPIVTNTVSSKLSDPNSIYNVSNDASINVTAAPNPFTQQTQLTVEGITGAFNFELFDVSGKLLQKKNGLSDNRFTINRENLSAGIYFYSIATTQKQKAFGRLVVE